MSKNLVRQTLVVWPLSLLILLSWVFPIHAQTGTGTLMGVATDSSGGMLPGVSLVIRNEATNTARTATTNDSGIYRVPVLQPGSYEVEGKMLWLNRSTLLSWRSRLVLQSFCQQVRLEFYQHG